MVYDLSDGRRIVIRPIRDSDRYHLLDGLDRLSARSRRMRFHGERTTFSEAELTYLVGCDGVDSFALVAIGLDENGNEEIGVGVVRAYRDANNPESGEVAVVVVDEWQSMGVGRRLLATLADQSRIAGIRYWSAFIFGENGEAMDLFASMGTVIERRWTDGTLLMIVDLVPE